MIVANELKGFKERVTGIAKRAKRSAEAGVLRRGFVSLFRASRRSLGRQGRLFFDESHRSDE